MYIFLHQHLYRTETYYFITFPVISLRFRSFQLYRQGFSFFDKNFFESAQAFMRKIFEAQHSVVCVVFAVVGYFKGILVDLFFGYV